MATSHVGRFQDRVITWRALFSTDGQIAPLEAGISRTGSVDGRASLAAQARGPCYGLRVGGSGRIGLRPVQASEARRFILGIAANQVGSLRLVNGGLRSLV